MIETFISGLAAFFTTASYVPQVHKCWKTGQVDDLSSKMLVILAIGLSLWVLYGFMKGDWVIILADLVSLALLSNLLWFKWRQKGIAA
jgi:MtN3 and saliva related transmembrane protein